MPKFNDIPQLTSYGNYNIHVQWASLLEWLESWEKEYNFDLNPDFQREHVWTEAQQIAYIEYKLRGGTHADLLLFNHPGWNSLSNFYKHGGVLVDGKQRLNAVCRFMKDEIPAFDYRYSQYTDRLRVHIARFTVHVNDLKTRKAVLQWYLELNAGGTQHTKKEIEKVKNLLKKETK